jgi:signal peptidase I
MANDDSRGSQSGSGSSRVSRPAPDALGPVSADYSYNPVPSTPPPPPLEFESKVVAPAPALDEPVKEKKQRKEKVKKSEETTEKAKGLGAVREIVETLLLAFIIFVAVRAVVLNFRVDGTSMIPNLHDKEMLLVNRNIYFHFDLDNALDKLPFIERDGEHVIYLFHPPERGDIIVFDPPTVADKPFIKRVIGLPGDTITIENGNVYRNGVLLDEPYIEDGITDCRGGRCDPVRVPDGMVYVLGDNRRNSQDSRIFGPIDVDSIIGKAWITYWPLDDFGLVPHYDYPEIKD